MYEIGGVTATVSDDAMQRAPVFAFDSAREARDFGFWIDESFDEIRRQAEGTTRTGKLKQIEKYHVGKIMYLRFSFTTGDAAGQNMVSKATYAARNWILESNRTILRFTLSGNIPRASFGAHLVPVLLDVSSDTPAVNSLATIRTSAIEGRHHPVVIDEHLSGDLCIPELVLRDHRAKPQRHEVETEEEPDTREDLYNLSPHDLASTPG